MGPRGSVAARIGGWIHRHPTRLDKPGFIGDVRTLAHLEPFRFEQTDEDRQLARQRLDEYMQKYVDEGDKMESIVAIGKGQGTQTTLTFPDGSVWVVPPGFHAATRD